MILRRIETIVIKIIVITTIIVVIVETVCIVTINIVTNSTYIVTIVLIVRIVSPILGLRPFGSRSVERCGTIRGPNAAALGEALSGFKVPGSWAHQLMHIYIYLYVCVCIYLFIHLCN